MIHLYICRIGSGLGWNLFFCSSYECPFYCMCFRPRKCTPQPSPNRRMALFSFSFFLAPIPSCPHRKSIFEWGLLACCKIFLTASAFVHSLPSLHMQESMSATEPHGGFRQWLPLPGRRPPPERCNRRPASCKMRGNSFNV